MFAALGSVERGSLEDGRIHDALKNQLCDAVADVNAKIVLAEIEEENANIPAIVGVNNAGADINTVLEREAGAGRNPAIATRRNAELKIGGHACAPSGSNDLFLSGKEIVSGGVWRRAKRGSSRSA